MKVSILITFQSLCLLPVQVSDVIDVNPATFILIKIMNLVAHLVSVMVIPKNAIEIKVLEEVSYF